MKKLEKKIFFTVFSIFTFFLLVIFIIFNYQNYNSELESINNSLTRINDISKNGKDNKNKDKNIEDITPDDNILDSDNNLEDKIIVDYNVYTVLINNDKVIDIINHSAEEKEIEEIENYAYEIINNNKEGIHIGNLYISNYSYFYQKGSFITIIVNDLTKEKLLDNLKTTIILFIILELIVILLSKIIVNYIVKPVEISFKKQKQFVADASHELKTPLAVIMASSDAIEGKNKDLKWLNNIKSEVNRMNDLVSDLLDLAKSEDDNSKKYYSNTDISKLITMSILTFDSLAFENNLELKYDIEDKIMFNCDSGAIKQLVGILIDNAIKHSNKNEEIKIELKKKKDEIILLVIDKGDEIKDSDREKIFERFYRADNSRNRDSNRYGLGLAIAKNIVTNHNGKITANSKDGYTTFKVVFNISKFKK